ncbi:MAG: ceramidase domain-containing protein [Pseudomonadota bacterium]
MIGTPMEWTARLDNYCERIDPSFWAEPVNAVTNAAFILAALVCWGMLGGKQDWGARLLTVILTAIGIGSFLFHTYATRWALMTDVAPITLFILTYVYLATTRFFGLRWWWGGAAVVAFFPYSAAVSAVVAETFGPLNGSVGYMPVALLIFGYALAMLPRDADTARGLAIGATILCVSLLFRTIDHAICPSFPQGTHFLWHILNGIMLGWMIAVYHRHGRSHAL